MRCFVLQNSRADGLEQFGSGSTAERAVVRNGDYLGRYQYAKGKFEPGEATEAAKDCVHPVAGDRGDFLAAHETEQVGAMPLLFFDEERERLSEIWVARRVSINVAAI